MKRKIQLIALIFFLFFQIDHSFAAKYYFSTSGDDSRTAAQAQNPSTPWQSISKLNAIFRSLQPGDEILFKRGDVFYGAINIAKSGTPGRPIKFDAYGSGPKPIITSLVPLADWKSLGNGVYEGSHRSLKHAVDVVVINDAMQEMGRYPNSDSDNKGYLTYESASWNSISDSHLSSSSNWSGGEVVIRKNFWVIDRHKIAWQSGKTISYNNFPVAQFSPSPGYGYFIQNHPNTLDKFGEWYFDQKANKVRVHFGHSSPQAHSVQVSTKDYLVTNSGIVRHVTFNNLHFKGSNKSAFHLGKNGSDVLISNSEVEFSGMNGIEIEGISNFRLENSTIRHTNNNGLVIKSSKGAVVKDNLIKDTFMFPGHGQNGNNNGVGIRTDSDNNLIEYNRVINTGYSGISFVGNDVTIKNNLIDHFCLTTNDGGGIYTYSSPHKRNSNRKVIGNIILNGVGVREGAIMHTLGSKPQAEGIYIDDNASHVEVVGNTVAHMTSKGIYLHNATNIRVRDNVVFDNMYQLYLRNDHMGTQMQDNLMENNYFLSKDAFQNHIHIRTQHNDVPKLANFASNFYATPLIDDFRIEAVQNTGSYNQAILQFNLQSWQNTFGKDWSSKTFEKFEKTFSVKRLLGSNKFKEGAFDQRISDVGCNSCTASLDRSGKLDGNSLKVNTNGISGTFLDIGSVQKGKRYILKFTARTGGKTIGLSSYLRHGKSPWETISEINNYELTSDRKNYEAVFTVMDDDREARLLFGVNQKEDAEFYLDNIEFYEAEVDLVDPSDVILFEYNDSKSPKKISLQGQYVDVKNNKYSSSVTIEPFSSVLLIKTANHSTKPQVPDAKISLVVPNHQSNYTAGSEIQMTAEVVDHGNSVTEVEFFNGDRLLGSSKNAPYRFTWKNVQSGKHGLQAKAKLKDASPVASSQVFVTVKALASVPDKPAPEQPDAQHPVDELPGQDHSDVFKPIFLNTGTTVDIEYKGDKYVGDSKFASYHKSTSIYSNKNAAPHELFQTERNGEKLQYHIPLPNGTYTVKTFHNELWFGKYGPAAAAGQRVFDIVLEGQTLKKNFDNFRENKNRPTELTFQNIQVTDGVLNLDLIASENRASISAIAIFKNSSEAAKKQQVTQQSLFYNTGTSATATYQGNSFQGESGQTGKYSASTANVNRHVSNEALFQTERYGRNLNYSIPIADGVYTIKTYHNELWFGSFGPNAQAGRRVFDISVEGEVKKRSFDIFVESRNKPTVLTFENVVVKDGVLNIDLSASRDNATISGIAIIPQGNATSFGANLRTMGEGSEADETEEVMPSAAEGNEFEIKVYPNPATDVATLFVGSDIGEFDILLHNTGGQLLERLDPSLLLRGDGQYRIPVDHLQKGVYLITIVNKREIVKRLRLIIAS